MDPATRERTIVRAPGKQKLRILFIFCLEVICLHQMAIANAPSDAEIAKKLQLKPGQEIIRKNGKRYLLSPLTDEDVDRMLQMKERFDKLTAGIPKPDPIHEASQKTYWKARNLMDSEKVDEAIPLYSKYIDQFKKESAAAKNENKVEHDFYLSWGYQNRAYCYLHNKKYAEGVADLSDAIKLRPNYVTNYVNRAKAYRLMGKTKLALDDDEKIMTLPKSSGRYTDLRREFATPKPGGGTPGTAPGTTPGTARPPSKAD
jgi:tetratricopeptide (TPR) repeat protein